ncbi:sortilin (neurotensin receptor 3) [Kribbella pratensis]|uniref:Sortilin (Neurotensin receptor 3) n=1 Tax=Kribbella pratensis TaxID=2512112 RepID=A0ABY2F9G9_9ACTN|nr:dispase autolysis-inducing protein [Kribbella pratensis]TDW87243.1 sortilin (neurotensin receptor 3) [Kribbella pratensis]
MTSRRFALATATVALLSVLSTPAVATPDPSWNRPHCGKVYGDGSVTFTETDGQVLAGTTGTLRAVTYAKVAALQEPNTLIGIGRQTIQRSSDAGCSWQLLDKTPDDLSTYDVQPGPGDSAYVYSVNDQPIHRVHGSQVTTVLGPVAGGGLAALDARPGRLRAVAGDGQLYDSIDDGTSWQRVGGPAAPDLFLYDAVVDPRNPDHVVAGVMSDGVYVTFDGGRTWTRSRPVERVNAFSLAMSPADPSKVWMEGYDRDRSTRFIWESTDGGQKFREVLDQSRADLVNGNKMWASPVDPDLLYFSYGTSFMNFGADLYRFVPSTGALTKNHNTFDGIPSLAFNPANPKILYLGLAEER